MSEKACGVRIRATATNSRGPSRRSQTTAAHSLARIQWSMPQRRPPRESHGQFRPRHVQRPSPALHAKDEVDREYWKLKMPLADSNHRSQKANVFQSANSVPILLMVGRNAGFVMNDRKSHPGRGPESEQASVIVDRMAVNVYHLDKHRPLCTTGQ